MINEFVTKKFAECNLNDKFFDSLRDDYDGFDDWFRRNADREALVFEEGGMIQAFLSLKEEYNEAIELSSSTTPRENRLKISTLKISQATSGKRIGEGVIGLALWQWQKSNLDYIYITVFPKQELLISQLSKYGFKPLGTKENGELVYQRSKKGIDYSNPFTCFPFVNPEFVEAGIIPIEAQYHDTLFPHSKLKNTEQEIEKIAAANGLTKVFLATPYTMIDYPEGSPTLIYRISDKGPRQYTSVVTSSCSIVDVTTIKLNNIKLKTYDEFLKTVGNRSVYSNDELEKKYKQQNLFVITLLYNVYFGEGNNVNYKTLKEMGVWGEGHPYQVKMSKNDFIRVLEEAKINVQNVIID
jgi:hypothetical protein